MNTLSQTKATIIIAAYNEATVIRKTLRSLDSTAALNSYQILVVCNGCSDDTEKIIRNEFQHIHCHSLPHASKALAIRYAESLNPGFPRLYMDADIQLSSGDAHALISMASEFDSDSLIIPRSNVITSNSHPLVKSFYRIWYTTSHVTESGYGAGTYLINQQGRKRFGIWPELIADDAFIRSQFHFDQTHIAQSHCVTVQAPKTVWALIKIKARSKLGNLELKAHLKPNKLIQGKRKTPNSHNTHHITVQQSTESLKWYDQITYILINSIALSIAKWHFMMGIKTWHRDHSNR